MDLLFPPPRCFKHCLQLPSDYISIIWLAILWSTDPDRSALSMLTRSVPCACAGLRNIMLNETLHKWQTLVHNNLMRSQLNLNLKCFVFPGRAQRFNKAVSISIATVNLNYLIFVAILILFSSLLSLLHFKNPFFTFISLSLHF